MSEWISVNDRLPDLDPLGMDVGEGTSDPILICFTCRDDDSSFVYRRVGFCTKIEGRIEWDLAELTTLNDLAENLHELIIVTHWMPLPEPPA